MVGERRIDERIQELVEAHRDQLAALVDQALEAELGRLVEERLAARNGNGQPAAVDQEEPAETVKLCAVCGERKPAKYRTVCERCRAQQRARGKREAAAALLEPDAEPRPARKRPKNKRGKLLGAVEQADLTARRVVIARAPVETIVDGDGRKWTLRRLPSLASAGPRAQPIATRRPRPSSRIA